MLGRTFKHRKFELSKLKRVVSTVSAREFSWNAHTCQLVRSSTNPRRTKQLEELHHNVVSCLESAVPTARSYGGRLGRLAQFGDAVPMHRALIAFGSNMGDRVGHIERALMEMERRRLNIKSVSSLYETEPMYVINQDVFLNGACEVSETDAESLLNAESDFHNLGGD
jgi:hypothetical protein